MSQEFIALIQKALFARDQAERAEGEQQLIAFRDSSIDRFFQECCEGLASETREVPIRQACGTLLKRCVGLVSPKHQTSFWLVCSLEVRKQLKNALLSLLINPNLTVRRSAADCISGVCAIELPRGQWPEIISVLVQNTSHQQNDVRQAAIITLGFICEALKAIHQKNIISPSDCEKILYGICLSMKKEEQDVEIKLNAVKALSDSLAFMDAQFQKKEVRDYVTTVLLENANHENMKIKIAALQCLIDYSKQLFAFLSEYTQPILSVTAPSIQNNDSTIAIPAMEVWTVVATETRDQLEHFKSEVAKRTNTQASTAPYNPLLPIYQPLLQLLIENLLKNEDDQDAEDEGDLTIQESAYKASAAVAEAVGQPCHVLFTSFIENTIKAQEWQKRKAGVLCFGALVEGQENDQVRPLALSAIPQIALMLNDQHMRVQTTVARVLAKVAENYPEIYISHQNGLQVLELVLQQANAKPRIAKHIMSLISFITENLAKFPANPVIDKCEVILQILLGVSLRTDLKNDDVQVINLAFVGVLNIMYNLREGQKVMYFLEAFLQQFQTVSSAEAWRREAIQAGLLAAMHGCLMKLLMMGTVLPEETLNQLYQVVIKHFQSVNDVTSDGLYMVSGIAMHLKKNFTPLLKEFINYLNHSIQKVQDPDTFKASIYCIADVARSVGSDFAAYLAILDFFLKCINESTLDRELKLHVYSCMADVVLGVGKSCHTYAYQILEALKIGFQAAVQFSQLTDPDSQDYADRLKEILIQSYTTILYAFNDPDPFAPMKPTLQWLFNALQALCDPKLKPTVEFVRSSLNCLLDFANYYKTLDPMQIRQMLQSPLVSQLYTILLKYTNQPENKDTIDYLQFMFSQQGLQYPIH